MAINATEVIDGSRNQAEINAKQDLLNTIYHPILNYFTESQLQTDFTSSINSLINQISNIGGGVITIPDGVFSLDASVGVTFKDNIDLRLNPNTLIKAKPNNLTGYELFRIHDVKNIKLSGGNIDGNRDQSTAIGGEWGMGISIKGAENINITGMNIKNTWGDGVYIGRTSTKEYSENIILSNLIIENCRRQGISIISLSKSNMSNILIKSINGTAPAAGIDFEPNKEDEVLQHINLENFHVENCAGNGFHFYLTPLKDKIKDNNAVSITLTNCSSFQNAGDLYMGGVDNEKVKGNINFYNCSFRNAKPITHEVPFCARHENNNANSIQWSFYDCLFERNDNNAQALIRGNSLADNHGGLHLYNPKFIQTGSGVYDTCIMFNNVDIKSFGNISVINPIQADCKYGLIRMNGPCKNLVLSDEFNSFNTEINNSSVQFLSIYNDVLYLNDGATLTIDTSLPFKEQNIVNISDEVAYVAFKSVTVNGYNKNKESVFFTIPKGESIKYKCLEDGTFSISFRSPKVADSVFKKIFVIEPQIIAANSSVKIDLDMPFATTGSSFTTNFNMSLDKVDARVYCLTADKISLYLFNQTNTNISLASFKAIINIL